MRSLKGRHIIISGGATVATMLCSPLEVRSIALACLGFQTEPGVQGGEAKAAVSALLTAYVSSKAGNMSSA